MYRLFVYMFILMVMINGVPEYNEYIWGGHTYRFMEEYVRLLPEAWQETAYENAGIKCQEYFGDSWSLLKIESYAEFAMIYDKADEFLNDYFISQEDRNGAAHHIIWAGFAKSTTDRTEPFLFQDTSNDEFGRFEYESNTYTAFNLNPTIFGDLPTDKTGIDLWFRFGDLQCVAMWLTEPKDGDANWGFPSVLSIEDCGRAGINAGAGLPYICQSTVVNEPVDCVVDDWYDDGVCCVSGGQERQIRDIIVPNEHYGNECPELEQYIDCNTNNICCPDIDSRAINWDTLTEEGENVPNINILEFLVNADDLSLNIIVELDYLPSSYADNEDIANFGVTYVLDFEDFSAHRNKINEPGTCQNRMSSSFENVNFENFWKYSDEPQNGNIGINEFLAYPPLPGPAGNKWEISMKNDGCNTVIYKGHFTWQQLRDCTSFLGSDSYTKVVADNNWLNLTGTFYINIVSPFWYGTIDTEYYRVYQLLSQPFVIAISSTVYVLGSTGINLMTMSIISVYKEDAQFPDFKLIVMTETAEYMQLKRDDTNIFEFIKVAQFNNNNNIGSTDFTASINSENSNCLQNKEYLCSQLWEINATNILCIKDVSGTDFSGIYAMTFYPQCKDETIEPEKSYCLKWLDDHPDIRDNEISLSAPLIWKDDICDPKIFTVSLISEMRFYADINYIDGSNVDPASYLYAVGEDQVFVEIWTDFPDDTLTIFNTELVNVWICTFSPDIDVPSQLGTDGNEETATSMGCFNNQRDSQYDVDFYRIFSRTQPVEPPLNHQFTEHNIGTISDIERFSFIVPDKVARDTLYIHAQIEVELQELTSRRRRRMLLNVNTANKIQHFGDEIGINHGEKHKNPLSPQEPYKPYNYNGPQQPLQPSPSPSSWIIIIGCLLGLVLIFNIIFMCYINCWNNKERGRGIISYSSIKNNTDSEYHDESEINAINNNI